jgi:hypothetical protein
VAAALAHSCCLNFESIRGAAAEAPSTLEFKCLPEDAFFELDQPSGPPDP